MHIYVFFHKDILLIGGYPVRELLLLLEVLKNQILAQFMKFVGLKLNVVSENLFMA